MANRRHSWAAPNSPGHLPVDPMRPAATAHQAHRNPGPRLEDGPRSPIFQKKPPNKMDVPRSPNSTTQTTSKNLPRSSITNHVQTFLGPASKAPCQAAWQSSLPVKPFSWFSTFMRFAQPTWQGRGGIMIRTHLPVLCGFRG